jgi:hypothetical protein
MAAALAGRDVWAATIAWPGVGEPVQVVFREIGTDEELLHCSGTRAGVAELVRLAGIDPERHDLSDLVTTFRSDGMSYGDAISTALDIGRFR